MSTMETMENAKEEKRRTGVKKEVKTEKETNEPATNVVAAQQSGGNENDRSRRSPNRAAPAVKRGRTVSLVEQRYQFLTGTRPSANTNAEDNDRQTTSESEQRLALVTNQPGRRDYVNETAGQLIVPLSQGVGVAPRVSLSEGSASSSPYPPVRGISALSTPTSMLTPGWYTAATSNVTGVISTRYGPVSHETTYSSDRQRNLSVAPTERSSQPYYRHGPFDSSGLTSSSPSVSHQPASEGQAQWQMQCVIASERASSYILGLKNSWRG